MKVLSFMPLVFLLVGDASGQVSSGPSEPPGVVVNHIGWHKETYIPALYEDPMRAHEEHRELVRDQKATIRGNVVRISKESLPTPSQPASRQEKALL